MIFLLRSLNEGEGGMENFLVKNLKINTRRFIEEISKKLLSIHKFYHNAKKQVEFYNVAKVKYEVEKRMNFLKEKNKRHFHCESEFQDLENINQEYTENVNGSFFVSFNRIENFPPDVYNFEIVIERIKDDDEFTDKKDYKMTDTRQIQNFKIETLYENFDHNTDKNNLFSEIHFGFPSKFVNLCKDIVNEKAFSGCSLSTFYIRILNKDNEEITRSSSYLFLDIFIVSIEDLLVSNSGEFKLNFPIRLKNNNKNIVDYKEFYIELDFSFKLGDIACISIYNRIYKLFSHLLVYEKECHNCLNHLLDVYFKNTVASMIRYILDNNLSENQSGCKPCSSCNIF